MAQVAAKAKTSAKTTTKATGLLAKPPAEKKDNSAEIKKLQQMQKAGTLTDRQATRLNFLKPGAKATASAPAQESPIANEQRPGLSQDQNAILDNQERSNLGYQGAINENLMGKIDANTERGVDMGGVSAIPGANDAQGWTQQQVDALYNQYTQRMQPQFDREAQDFEQQMINRGIPVGSELYNQQKQQLQQNQNDAKQQALSGAIATGNDYASGIFGRGMQTHQTQYGEAVDQYNRPIDTAAKLGSMVDYTFPAGAQEQQYKMDQAAQQQKYDIQMLNKQTAAQKSLIKSAGGSSGGSRGSGASYAPTVSYPQQQQQSYTQPPWYAAPLGTLVGGLAQGVGSGIGNWVSGLFGNNNNTQQQQQQQQPKYY